MYKKIFVLEMITLTKSLILSGASCYPNFMGNYPAICHTCYPYLPRR